jgi:hypothetical protein
VKPPQTGSGLVANYRCRDRRCCDHLLVSLGNQQPARRDCRQPAAATQATPASPQGEAQQAPAQENTQQASQQQQGSSNAPTTTGQGSREQGDAEQKTNSGQPSNQQPTNAIQNASPTENSGQQAQPRQRQARNASG